MNLPFFIARRYFFTRKKRGFIGWLSILSIIGVGVGTMALVVVLSVFNGMEELNRTLFRSVEADLTISPRQGKRFEAPPTLLTALGRTPGADLVTPVIQDNALARYNGAQTVVTVKGVANNYLQRSQLDSALVDGRFRLQTNGINYAIVAEGIRNDLSIVTQDILTPLELLYPQNQSGSRTLNLLSENAFSTQALTVSGVFFVDAQQYGDFVIAPLPVVRELVGYGPNELTSIELQLKPGTDLAAAKAAVQTLAGDKLLVRDRDDLNVDLYRAINIEKLTVGLTLSFIILIASVNIFFSLSMLVIEKKNDIRTLLALGATPGLIRRVFLTEGAIISLSGAVTGLVLGVGLCWLQERYGLVGVGTTSSIIDAYPVRVDTTDLWITALIVLGITALTSWFPAQRAAKIRQTTN
ncbi:ABC transporter permease [Rudanella lutea]|uniref:ABC transporter permease n=1 Tax=Rudanella lutea TaxID=451374 RepID=UPI0003698C1A|nr:ABC transporter permease [Rudanella lutea]